MVGDREEWFTRGAKRKGTKGRGQKDVYDILQKLVEVNRALVGADNYYYGTRIPGFPPLVLGTRVFAHWHQNHNYTYIRQQHDFRLRFFCFSISTAYPPN